MALMTHFANKQTPQRTEPPPRTTRRILLDRLRVRTSAPLNYEPRNWVKQVRRIANRVVSAMRAQRIIYLVFALCTKQQKVTDVGNTIYMQSN